MAKLTPKQQRFVEEYLIDLNATQAAIRAGYSAKNADNISSDLLGKSQVSEAIYRKMDDRSRRTEITADRVLIELASIAFADITDYVQVITGSVIVADTDSLTTEKRKALAGIKQGKDGIEVKLHDKLKALELLGKHLGTFKEKIEHSGHIDFVLPDEIKKYAM